MRHLALVFTLTLSSALAGCDPAGAPTPDEAEFFFGPLPVNQCGRSGGLYGPCDYNLSSPCVQGLFCLETIDGNMCVPPSPDPQNPKALPTCKGKLGTMLSCDGGQCVYQCDEAADCLGGTICSEIPGACVWPFSPEGETSTG